MRRVLIVLAGLTLVAFALSLNPLGAQDTPPLYTNTPIPQFNAPDAPVDFYALRLWTENDLVDTVAQLIVELVGEEPGAREAVRLTLYELERRFPGAPTDPARRERLLALLMAAPRGSIDMRAIARPYLLNALNTERPSFTTINALEYGGFGIDIAPMNFDGDETTQEAILGVFYPTDAEGDLIYNEYLAAQIDAGGAYRLLPASPDYPAAPLDAVQTVNIANFGDFNQDGLDDLALEVTSSLPANSRELLLYTYRGGQMVTMIAPDGPMHFGRRDDLIPGESTITLIDYQLESAAWGCLSEAPLEWRLSSNFFRLERPITPPIYIQQDSLTCRMYNAEPIFAAPPPEAINTVQTILADFPPDTAGADRAAMVLVMLYALNGERETALSQAEQLLNLAEPDSWLAVQAETFLRVARSESVSDLDLCAAIQLASDFGACSVDEVLARLFSETPLQRSEPLLSQLEDRGLSVLQSFTISEVGRAPREVVQFNIPGASWWAFAPLDRSVYTAERLDQAPPGYAPATLPPALISPPLGAYEALYARNDLAGALAALSTAVSENPDIPLTSEGLYVQALIYDLSGDRIAARQAYYDLWERYPLNLWGQLASVHLERRQ